MAARHTGTGECPCCIGDAQRGSNYSFHSECVNIACSINENERHLDWSLHSFCVGASSNCHSLFPFFIWKLVLNKPIWRRYRWCYYPCFSWGRRQFLVDGGPLLEEFGGSLMVQMDTRGRCGSNEPLFVEIGEAFVTHPTLIASHCFGWTVTVLIATIPTSFLLDISSTAN